MLTCFVQTYPDQKLFNLLGLSRDKGVCYVGFRV